MRFEMTRNRSHEAGDLRLHIHCAARDQIAVDNIGCKGIDTPGRSVTYRYDIRVAREAKVWSFCTKARVKIVDIFERITLAGEAERFEGFLQHIQRPFVSRRDRRAADQARRKRKRTIDEISHAEAR